MELINKMSLKIVCCSDTHGQIDIEDFPAGDVLVLAGDIFKNYFVWDERKGKKLEMQLNALKDLDEYAGNWIESGKYKYVIQIAGNHDWIFQYTDAGRNLKNIKYLQDEEIIIDGIKFYGSPWQPEFCNWAFNLPRNGPDIEEKWLNIPDDVDVLITHGPPFGILDEVDRIDRATNSHHVGCEKLLYRLQNPYKPLRPKLAISGHIHSGYGRKVINNTVFINAAICTEAYEPTNQPFVEEIIK